MISDENYKRINTLFYGILIIIFLLLPVLVVLLIMYFIKTRSIEVDKTEFYEYQFLQMDNSEVSPLVGFVTIPEKLEEYEFKSYVEEDGTQVLVSHIGQREYQCSGSCYCESTNDERRTASSIAGLKYLLVASTTALAFSIARNHFQEECVSEMSSTTDDDISCPPDSVRSEVDDCSDPTREHLSDMVNKIPQDGYDNTPVSEVDQDFTEEDMKYLRDGLTIYLCKGKCLRMDFRKDRLGVGNDDLDEDGEEPKFLKVLDKFQAVADEIECSKMEFKSEVVVDEFEKEGDNELGDLFYADGEIRAVHEFQEWELHQFCENNSEKKVRIGRLKNEIVDEWLDITEAMCVGHMNQEINPSVKCRKKFSQMRGPVNDDGSYALENIEELEIGSVDDEEEDLDELLDDTIIR